MQSPSPAVPPVASSVLPALPWDLSGRSTGPYPPVWPDVSLALCSGPLPLPKPLPFLNPSPESELIGLCGRHTCRTQESPVDDRRGKKAGTCELGARRHVVTSTLLVREEAERVDG